MYEHLDQLVAGYSTILHMGPDDAYFRGLSHRLCAGLDQPTKPRKLGKPPTIPSPRNRQNLASSCKLGRAVMCQASGIRIVQMTDESSKAVSAPAIVAL